MRNRFDLLFLLILLTGHIQAQPNAERANILWIVSEDTSPLMGCYGDTFATTPFIDQLAREGVLYENAFATAPACAPSRSTLITGMLASSMGTENMRSRNLRKNCMISRPIRITSTTLRMTSATRLS